MAVNCWAASISPCSPVQSREHYLTKGLFNAPYLELRGFPWCKDEPMRIGMDGASAKMLCKRHNEELGRLDDAAIMFFRHLRAAYDLMDQHRAERVKFHRYRANANLVERWLLKTLINMLYESKLLLGPESTVAGVPTAEQVATCFGRTDFTGGAGMYVAASAGMIMNAREAGTFFPLLIDDRVICACLEFLGFRMMLNLDPAQRPTRMPRLDGEGDSWSGLELKRPFRKLRFPPVGEIKLEWRPMPAVSIT